MIISKKKYTYLEESVTHLSNENINLKHEKAQIMEQVDETLNIAYALVGAVITALGREMVEITQGDINRFVAQKKCLVELDGDVYRISLGDRDEED
jgi:hypothetical protein